MPLSCYIHAMANLQVKNIPEQLHQRLRQCAEDAHCTLGDVVLEAIDRELARREWHARFSTRAVADLGTSAATLLQEARTERDQESS
jgi:plasmid stability protein